MQQSALNVSTDDVGDEEVLAYIKQNNPDIYSRLVALPPQEQQRAMAMMRNDNNKEEIGDI